MEFIEINDSRVPVVVFQTDDKLFDFTMMAQKHCYDRLLLWRAKIRHILVGKGRRSDQNISSRHKVVIKEELL